MLSLYAKILQEKKFNWHAFLFLITAETAGVDKIPSLHWKEKIGSISIKKTAMFIPPQK